MVLNVDNSNSIQSIIESTLELPLNEAIPYMNMKLKDTERADLPKEFNLEKNPIKKIISLIGSWADARYKNKYNTYRVVSDEVNAIYKKIDNIIQNDIAKRNAAANKRVIGDVYSLRIKNNKIKNKYYDFTIASVFIPVDQVMDLIKQTMRRVSYMRKKEEIDKEFEQTKKAIDGFLENNYWYVLDTEVISGQRSVSAPLEAHIQNTKNGIDYRYAVLVNETNYMSSTTTYLLMIQKAYDECYRLYDKVEYAMPHIDEIFKECLKYTQKSMEFNFNGSNIAFTQFKAYAEQMEKFYEIVRE